MSSTAEDKLPEDFFQKTLKEKAELIKKYNKYTGSPLVFIAHIGPNMATFKFYSLMSSTAEDKLPEDFFQKTLKEKAYNSTL